jgi:hypothetical protein
MTLRLLPIGVVAAVLAGSTSTLAQTQGEAAVPAPPPAGRHQRPIMAYGEENAACLQWTDDCFTCAKQTDGATACSTAGAACVASAIRCTKATK